MAKVNSVAATAPAVDAPTKRWTPNTMQGKGFAIIFVRDPSKYKFAREILSAGPCGFPNINKWEERGVHVIAFETPCSDDTGWIRCRMWVAFPSDQFATTEPSTFDPAVRLDSLQPGEASRCYFNDPKGYNFCWGLHRIKLAPGQLQPEVIHGPTQESFPWLKPTSHNAETTFVNP